MLWVYLIGVFTSYRLTNFSFAPSLGYHDNLCGNNGTKPVYRNASTGREWRYFFKNTARLQVRFLTWISHQTRFRGETAGNVAFCRQAKFAGDSWAGCTPYADQSLRGLVLPKQTSAHNHKNRHKNMGIFESSF